MPKITIYNQKGEKKGAITLNPKIFEISERPSLIHRVVISKQANARKPIASVKTRSEVSGGGKKPWKQKGTGRARAGSIRSPLWRGGGVIFGPSASRNFKKQIPQKMVQKAMISALSIKFKSGKIIMLDKIDFEKIATSQVEKMLAKLPIKEGTILLVLPKLDPKIILSCSNLPYFKVSVVSALNLLDLLKYDYLILTKEATGLVEKMYLKE